MVDMTKGNTNKVIIKFALPMILGNIFQQTYNLIDTIIVGKFVGANALAAVGSSFAIMVFITSVIIGLAMGVGVLFSQLYGAKKLEEFKDVTITAIIFIGLVTLILMIFSLLNINFILDVFNMPKELLSDAKLYILIILLGLIFTFIYNLSTALLRSVGDSKRPLYFLLISSFINIVLDLVFVINFKMGVAGVAFATIISQFISSALAIFYVYKSMKFVRFGFSEIRIKKKTLKLVAKYSVMTAIQQSIMNFGILIVQGLVNTFGVTVMAAFAAGVKVDSIAYMPVQDFGNAFATFVAQNKGANKHERISNGIKDSIKIIILFCVAISFLIIICAKKIMLLFVDKNQVEVINIGVSYISVVAIFYVLIGFLFMFYGLFRGLGKFNISIILTVVSLGTRIVLAYILSATFLRESGIWWSIPIGWAIADILALFFILDTIKELVLHLSEAVSVQFIYKLIYKLGLFSSMTVDTSKNLFFISVLSFSNDIPSKLNLGIIA